MELDLDCCTRILFYFLADCLATATMQSNYFHIYYYCYFLAISDHNFIQFNIRYINKHTLSKLKQAYNSSPILWPFQVLVLSNRIFFQYANKEIRYFNKNLFLSFFYIRSNHLIGLVLFQLVLWVQVLVLLLQGPIPTFLQHCSQVHFLWCR